MRLPAALGLVLCLVVSVPSVSLARDQFEGKWNVTLTPEDGGKEVRDTVVFKANTFTSTEFQKQGFGTTEYEEDTRRGPIAKFVAKPKSEKQGTMEWSGSVTGADMQGEVTWTKPDGSVVRYTLKGSREG
jgi:hypothetical protein